MEQQIEVEQVYAASSRASMSLRESHNFETIFHIPATHRLVLVRSRSQGCPPLRPLTGNTMNLPQTGVWWRAIEALSE